MSSSPAELRGAQRPRLLKLPTDIVSTTAGKETVELARSAGLNLYPAQAWAVEMSLAERANKRYAAFEVVDIESRQNGKGGKIEARELGLLFLLGEKLGMHSTHQFDTTLEAFGRLMTLIESTPDLDNQVAKVWTGNGKEGIQTKNGSRLRFRARTRSGGRGWAGVDLLVLDEAQELPETALGSVVPTLSTRPNAQIWFTGSAVDQQIHANGVVLARLRHRGIHGKSEERLFLCEFSSGEREDLDAGRIDIDDPRVIAEGNPALGYLLTLDGIARERRLMTPRQFSVERLSIGDWPNLEELDAVINQAKWRLRAIDMDDEEARRKAKEPLSSTAISVECSPDRSWTWIASAGRRTDGAAQLEVVARDEGVEWAYGWLKARNDGRFCSIGIDPRGPAKFMLARLSELDIKVDELTAGEAAQACVGLVVAVDEGGILHPDQAQLNVAAQAVTKRSSGEFEPVNARADVAPIRAAAFALHGLVKHSDKGPPNIW